MHSEILKMLPLGLIYAVGELLTLRSVQKAMFVFFREQSDNLH